MPTRRKWTGAQRSERERVTRELIAIAELVVDGKINRHETVLRAWPHQLALRERSAREGRIRLSGDADALLTCLVEAEECLPDGELLIRKRDVEDCLRCVRIGFPMAPLDESRPLATVKLPLLEVVRRTGVEDHRYCLEGIGWFQFVRFASLATGTPFMAIDSLEKPARVVEVRGYGAPTDSLERGEVLADLFDTLGVDASDCESFDGALRTEYDLMRLDDNGHQFVISTFTGYEKALARLREFESHHHKQSYWIVERELPRPT